MILSHRSRRVSNLRKKSPDGHCLTGAFLYWNQWAGLFGHKGIESLGFRGHLTLDFPFCHRVCELTGAENGYEHVRVCGERKTIHDNRKNEDEVRKANVVEFDEPFFDNKMVLVFDDVITKGLSYAKYANQLERLGACVIGGMFLARTHYKVR